MIAHIGGHYGVGTGLHRVGYELSAGAAHECHGVYGTR